MRAHDSDSPHGVSPCANRLAFPRNPTCWPARRPVDGSALRREQRDRVLHPDAQRIHPLEGVRNISALVEQLVAAGTLSVGNGHSLEAPLNATVQQIEGGLSSLAVDQRGAFGHEVDAMMRSGRLSEADAAELASWASRVGRSLSR